MNNGPSKTITSTTPAPGVDSSTSREGKPMSLAATEGINTPPAPDAAAAPDLVKKIGKTTYRVRVHFSETSRETMSDKIKRMLRNEVSQM